MGRALTVRNVLQFPYHPPMHGNAIGGIMTDNEKITAIAVLAVNKMKELQIPSTMSYDMAEELFREFKKKGAKLPPGFTAALTVKIKDLLK